MPALSSSAMSSETRIALICIVHRNTDTAVSPVKVGCDFSDPQQMVPQESSILPFWEAASPNSLANFSSNLGHNSPAQETVLGRLLTSLLPCKNHLFHDLKPAHPVLAVIIRLQIAIQYSPVITSLKEDDTYWKEKALEPISIIFSRSDTTGQIGNVFRTPTQFWDAKVLGSSAEHPPPLLSLISGTTMFFSNPSCTLLWN